MRFLADMGISPRTVNWLKAAGYDAIHLVEEGLERLADDEILVKAREEGRILLTVDLDFGYLLAVSGETLPSVILLSCRLRRINTKLPDSRFHALSAPLPVLAK
ncbi:MAG: DUF5615 family PIN-like protein [Coleofasciculus sp. G3-WIS-01]|uniref:DUF5615 family PIN-like protein n=1 Tax=Coleofasciculus sp. G3-WIS-01 TaxID=3069528 RepID=UPI0032FB55DC